MARWPKSAGYPAVRVVDVDQPVVIDRHVVTFWEAVSDDGDRYASVAEVAEVLVKLHKLTVTDDLHLPELSPCLLLAGVNPKNLFLTAPSRPER